MVETARLEGFPSINYTKLLEWKPLLEPISCSVIRVVVPGDYTLRPNHEWEMLFQDAHVNKCGLTLSEVEPSLFVKIRVDELIKEKKTDRRS